MADFTLTVYDATKVVSSAPNYTDSETAATSGNNYYIPNNGRVLLIAEAATTANLTVQTPNTQDGNAISDLVLALADTDIRIFGPFAPAYYNDAQGRMLVTVSANTNLMAIRC
jgi:hypothetical protein